METVETPSRPATSAGPSPSRRPGSVRRTTSLDVTWPNGAAGPACYLGRARDLLTPLAGPGDRTLSDETFEAMLTPERIFIDISGNPPREPFGRLIGHSAAIGYRRALAEIFPGSQAQDTAIFLALDDIPGANIVAGVAWSHWDSDWQAKAFGDTPLEVLLEARRDVCIGHATGSSAQDPSRSDVEEGQPLAVSPWHSGDAVGWHRMEEQAGVGFRRARRIDVWLDDRIVIDSEFQDSVTSPSGERLAVHEYGLHVTADKETLVVLSIEAEPRVLPYAECPSVRANLPRLLGVPLPDLRRTVPQVLRGAVGCTHLNDAFRALAAVPSMLDSLA